MALSDTHLPHRREDGQIIYFPKECGTYENFQREWINELLVERLTLLIQISSKFYTNRQYLPSEEEQNQLQDNYNLVLSNSNDDTTRQLFQKEYLVDPVGATINVALVLQKRLTDKEHLQDLNTIIMCLKDPSSMVTLPRNFAAFCEAKGFTRDNRWYQEIRLAYSLCPSGKV